MAEQTKVIANTVIHRTVKPGVKGNRKDGVAPVKPTIQVIKAGTIFQTRSKEEYDDLLAMGAIRLPEKGEKVEVAVENIVAEEPGSGGRTSVKATGSRGETATTGVTKHGSRTGSVSDGSDLV